MTEPPPVSVGRCPLLAVPVPGCRSCTCGESIDSWRPDSRICWWCSSRPDPRSSRTCLWRAGKKRKERGGGGRRGQRQTNTRTIFTTRPGACVPLLHAAFWNHFIIIVCDDSVRLTIKWSLFSTVCIFQSLLRNIWLWSGLMTSTSTLGPSETMHHSGRTETVKTRDGTRWDLGLATKEYQVLS